MKKGIIFTLGVIVGAAGGSAATYFIAKCKFQTEKDEELEEMENFFEERFQKRVKKLGLVKKKPKTEPEVREDEKIASNKGVKKYHHQEDSISEYGAENTLFKKKDNKKKESKLIIEINEAEFLNEQSGAYEKQTIDVFIGDDATVVGIWANGTDNEEFVEKRFNKPLDELIGRTDVDYLLTYCCDVEVDDGLGLMYVRNNEIMTDFEVVIHDDREDDK